MLLLDAGWSSRNSILQGSPAVNMDELLALAKEKKRAALALGTLDFHGPQ